MTPTDGDTGLYFTEYGGGDPFNEVSDMPEGHPNMIWFDDGTVESGEDFYVYSDFALPDVDGEYIPEGAIFSGEGFDGYAVVLRQTPTTERTSVPEPSIIALFAAGLFGIGFARRRKA
jgi:hypothetical protein